MLPRVSPAGPGWLLIAFCVAIVSTGAVSADDKKPEKKSQGGVVIDFSTLPQSTENGDLAIHVGYAGITTKPTVYTGTISREDMAQIYFESLKTSGVKAERFDGDKVRILGVEDKKGVFHPATKGTVSSKTIKREQLPEVTNPPQA